MKIRRGIPVVDGVVIAEAFVLEAEHYRLPTQRLPRAGGVDSEWIDAEWQRFQQAVAAAKDEVNRLKETISDQVPADVARILEFQVGLYDDPQFTQAVREQLERGVSVEHAVTRRVTSFRKVWAGIPFLASKLTDLDDFERRLLRHLLGEKRESLKDLTTQVIVIARDLTPQQIAELPADRVLGFATDHGGKTSHTAILAQGLDLPAVVGLGMITGDVTGGELVILDGRRGKVIVDPDEATLKLYRQRQKEFVKYQKGLDELVTLPAETLDGHRIRLFANIGYPEEIRQALKFGAEGIGLYRTEFLYDEDNPDPDEEDHFTAYSRALEELGGRPLVIRTLDLGADKFRPEGIEHEQNPFLGCRSIRYCLMEREDVFVRQLRAILRVSTRGDVRIMLPMISSLEELNLAKDMIEDVKAELRASGQPINEEIPVGIMIEVPSAALLADVLAQHADFFSIGTNDLVQYVLAVDRTNEKVQDLYQPAHPAMFRLVLQAVKAARRHKIPVSICGELSGDPLFTLPLLGLGLRDLSMAPALIPRIKRFIRSISGAEAGRAIDDVLKLDDARRTLDLLGQLAKQIDPDFFV